MRSVDHSRSAGDASPSTGVAPHSSGRPAVLVGVGGLGGGPSRAGDLGDARVREVGAVGVARAPVDERAHAHAAAARVAEALDLALVDADAAAGGLLDPGLGVGGAGVRGGLDRPPRDLLEVHAVPPTVSSRMRTCGWPTPAGTDCPPLPQ